MGPIAFLQKEKPPQSFRRKMLSAALLLFDSVFLIKRIPKIRVGNRIQGEVNLSRAPEDFHQVGQPFLLRVERCLSLRPDVPFPRMVLPHILPPFPVVLPMNDFVFDSFCQIVSLIFDRAKELMPLRCTIILINSYSGAGVVHQKAKNQKKWYL